MVILHQGEIVFLFYTVPYFITGFTCNKMVIVWEKLFIYTVSISSFTIQFTVRRHV